MRGLNESEQALEGCGYQIIQRAHMAARSAEDRTLEHRLNQQESAEVVQKRLPALVQEISPAGLPEAKEQLPRVVDGVRCSQDSKEEKT